MTASRGIGRSWAAIALCGLIVVVSVGLRLYALRSDPYPRLDWSAGLLTDEGYYIHNARNHVLFGRDRTDEFNNMLLAPVLHYVQVAVFKAAGVGSRQARLISVVCSLGAMALLWCTIRPLFGSAAAWLAAALLGLDHTNLLFSRMALMDPFAALLAVAAFACFVRGVATNTTSSLVWHVAGGALLAATVLNRSLCLYLLPAPFVALAAVRGRAAAHAAAVVGLVLVGAIWAIFWWAPNRTEMDRMSRHYRYSQVQPQSVRKLMSNLTAGAVGDHRGISPYLFRHTPVAFALSLVFLVGATLDAGLRRVRNANAAAASADSAQPARSYALTFLVVWLVLGWLALSASNYSPARYYVTTYPAMMALAAIAAVQLPHHAGVLLDRWVWARIGRAALGGFLVFHAVQSMVHRGGVVGHRLTFVLLIGVPFLGALLLAAFPLPRRTSPARPVPLSLGKWSFALVAATIVLWLGANGYWLQDWLRTLRYTQFTTSRELGRILPANSVLLGDVAPGLCLDNRLVAVNVIPGLCNSDRPVEAFEGRPRYIAILDSRWKEQYWLSEYPELVRPDRRMLLRRVLRWDIGVYPVETSVRAESLLSPEFGCLFRRCHA